MYEHFEHTADLGLRARADDLEILFADAARALFSAIVLELETIRPEQARQFVIAGEDRDYLLLDWLNELLYVFEVEHLLFSDFTVKLTDVYPDGRSMLVTDGILRARFRDSFERPELLQPGQIYELTVDLWSTSLVLNKGHRIRVAVSSSNAPRFEPNPNTGGTDAPRVATNTLHLSSEHPSHILLPIYRGSPTEREAE